MDTRNSNRGKELEALDELIAEITTDAYSDDEQLWAFRQAFEDDVALPADGFVIGEPILVIAIDYDGNERRGLTAKCRREAGAEYEDWAEPIIAHGPRPMFKMEQILPGEDPDDPFNDPIIQSNELKNASERAKAITILMGLCQADLRCLDAHSHLGNFVFDHHPRDAIRHYEVGLRIGELSLGDDFTGVLPWSLIDNRPFLRCMHGYGLCLWRLERFDEAAYINVFL